MIKLRVKLLNARIAAYCTFEQGLAKSVVISENDQEYSVSEARLA